ncbi:MAG: ferritin [Pirellulales bacterium]
MLSQVVQDAINEQVNNELYSSYLYLAMSAYCERQQFLGSAKWLRMQSEEEYGHAMRLYDFLTARAGVIHLKAIAEPPTEFPSVPDVFAEALRHEQGVTARIDHLYEMAFTEKAFSALVELQWFITEQVEEEKTSREIVHKFNLVKADPASLLELDRELGQRSAEPAATATNG